MVSHGMIPGDTVVAYLQSPREKLWGQLVELTNAGLTIYGLDLAAFDDWVRSITSGEGGIGLATVFIPMWRIERIAKDQPVGGVPSVEDQLQQRAGVTLNEYLEQTQATQLLPDDLVSGEREN